MPTNSTNRVIDEGKSLTRQVKIMIVDDNATFRNMIRESLEPVSTDILECSDGQEAVDSYDQHLPD